MTKQKIIKIALNELINEGIGQISIHNISKNINVNEDKVKDLFAKGDCELIMDAVEYAGKTWVQEIKNKVDKIECTNEKLKFLVNGYVLGSKDYPQSLSVYIDLWKIIKDNKDDYIKKRLKELYNFYMVEFINMILTIGNSNLPKEELEAFSLLITILSDVIHIQSITLENDINFDTIGIIIEKITKAFLNEKCEIKSLSH